MNDDVPTPPGCRPTVATSRPLLGTGRVARTVAVEWQVGPEDRSVEDSRTEEVVGAWNPLGGEQFAGDQCVEEVEEVGARRSDGVDGTEVRVVRGVRKHRGVDTLPLEREHAVLIAGGLVGAVIDERVLEAERCEDPFVEQLGEGLPGHDLDDVGER